MKFNIDRYYHLLDVIFFYHKGHKGLHYGTQREKVYLENIGAYSSLPLCSFVMYFVPFVVKYFKFPCLQNKNLIAFLLLSASIDVFCQEVKISERIIEIAEELAADEDDPGSAELFSEILFELSQDPVKLNSGDEKEISRLFFLTDFQVKVLVDYVKTTGKILTPYEISNIPGFDRETAEMLIPFVTFVTMPANMKNSTRLRQTILTNLLIKSSLPDTTLLGSPLKILTKYKFTKGRISGGLTTEKDPGEKYFSGKTPLPDFYSLYLSYKGRGMIRQIILGDFSARFGQGTNINTEMRTGLSLTNPGYLSGRSSIRPYTSTDENNLFRGAAVELSYRNIDLDLYYSTYNIDATLNLTADSAGSTIKSFYTTGLHSTEGNNLKKDAVSETDWGAHLSLNLKRLRTGVIASQTRFSIPVLPDLSDPADRNDFTGNKNSVYTIYYNVLVKRSSFFGEISTSGLNKYAFVQGLSLRPSGRICFNLLYRHYSPGFTSFHGKGPSGSSTGTNEYGITGNITCEAAKYLFISTGSQIRYYPWLRYNCSSPSMAKRNEVRLNYLPSQKLVFEIVYSRKITYADGEEENRIPRQNEILTRSIKGTVKYSVSEYLTLLTRTDYKLAGVPESRGMLLLQDVNLRLRQIPVSFWFRYCIFNTGGYDSGLYTWENDLVNSFSVPVLYGNGSRSYIMINWNLFKQAEIRLKYGTVSSMDSNSRIKNVNEFKLQFRISF